MSAVAMSSLLGLTVSLTCLSSESLQVGGHDSWMDAHRVGICGCRPCVRHRAVLHRATFSAGAILPCRRHLAMPGDVCFSCHSRETGEDASDR